MKLLSALYHEEIEEYIKYLPGIEVLDAVRDKRSLLHASQSQIYDLVLISKNLPGSEEVEYLIEVLTSGKLKNQRVVFIYGEYDRFCDDFIRFLLDRQIYDFHVGDEISSKDIERLIFRPACKETAFGYFKSRFDNEVFFKQKEQIQRKNNRFFNGFSIAASGIKPFLKADNYKKIIFEKLVISIISNQATGKSHTAWNLGACFSKYGYDTSLFNVDRGYSANMFFDIDEIYYDLLDYTIENNMHRDILDNCCRRKNLGLITGRPGDEREIDEEDFIKLLYNIRTKSDITIIDTRTGLTASTRLSVKSSTYDLLIFDCDIMHFHMNIRMLEELKDDFVPEKTIAVINNTNIKSSSHKFIYNEIIGTGIHFKDIVPIRSCGFLSTEVMHTGLSPYQTAGEENKSFVRDIDSLLERLSARPVRKGSAAGIFRK